MKDELKFDRLEIRISCELKEKFNKVIDDNNEVRSSVVRDLIRRYIAENKAVDKND